MYFHNVVGTGSYTTSTTNMYKKDFTYLHPRGHSNTSHVVPMYPWWHSHSPTTQSPCPWHNAGHSILLQAPPIQPLSHAQVPGRWGNGDTSTLSDVCTVAWGVLPLRPSNTSNSSSSSSLAVLTVLTLLAREARHMPWPPQMGKVSPAVTSRSPGQATRSHAKPEYSMSH